MSDIAIRVENIGKQYRIGAHQYNKNLREALQDAFWAFFRRTGRLLQGQISAATELEEEIWALRGVSFQVKKGEVIGIIGNNGSGKSTLLKVLSRITIPTEGNAEVHGRMGSLLEVGTGFHAELTGRENIFLSSAILGMKHSEALKNFDEILKFAEIDKFIDTPVKHYSSGMYLRLAFAVAAHLETEILLVDEILAVGDTQFQNKCMGKMQSISNEKRTIIFVSHNMSAINRLCNRVLWMDKGSIRLDGKTEDVINKYLTSQAQMQACRSEAIISENTLNSEIRMESIRIISHKNQLSHIVDFNSSFRVEIRYEILEQIRSVSIVSRLTDLQGSVICTSWDTDTTQWRDRVRNSGNYTSICIIPPNLLRPGRYFISVGALNETKLFAFHENVISFEVSASNYTLNIGRVGIITPLFEWEVRQNG